MEELGALNIANYNLRVKFSAGYVASETAAGDLFG